MTWQELGRINLSYDWQFLALPSGNYGLFRIKQIYSDTDYIHGKIVIGQAFSELKEFYTYKAIFPSKNRKIIKLLPPLELIKADNSPNRYLAFKLDSRYYRYSVGWQIQIEIEDVIPTTLDEIKILTTINRGELALIQQQLAQIEQGLNTTTGQ